MNSSPQQNKLDWNLLDKVFNYPGLGISFLGSLDKLVIYLNPIDFYLLPDGINKLIPNPNLELKKLSDWLNKNKEFLDCPNIFGFLGYEAYLYFLDIMPSIKNKDCILFGLFINYQKIITVTPDNFEVRQTSKDSIWQLLANEEKILIDFAQLIIKQINQSTDPSLDIKLDPPTERDFINGVNYIKNQILLGNVYQTNLSLNYSQVTKKNTAKLFFATITAEKGRFSCYLNCSWISNNLKIISNSPELFLKKDGNFVYAEPIKGTLKLDSTTNVRQQENKLKDSKKDLAELAMIVDLFRNDLGKVCKIGSIKVENYPAVMRLNNLIHLYAIIKGELNSDVSDLDLIRACFPSGSITGAPKYSAIKIIDKLEAHYRGAYCGSFFNFSQSSFLSSVAIRTFTINDTNQQNQVVNFFAGGGITIDSEPNREYQEALLKLRSLMSKSI